MATGDGVLQLAILGVGGVGGYFGGRIAAAIGEGRDPGWAVHFIARGEHLAVLQAAGLTLDAAGRRIHCRPASSVGSLAEAPVPDVVLLCVKGYDLDEAARQVAAHSHASTVVVPLLNGVGIHERVSRVVSTGSVLPACALVGTHLERPGLVEQVGDPGRVFLGADPAHPGRAPRAFLRLLEASSIDYRWFDDPRPAICRSSCSSPPSGS
jgi:2-dehydropantoate 2-reductase